MVRPSNGVNLLDCLLSAGDQRHACSNLSPDGQEDLEHEFGRRPLTEKAIITETELLRLANIAKEQGVAISLERDGTRICITPCHAPPGLEPPRQGVRGPRIEPPPPLIDSEFDHRERAAMEQLVAAGVGIPLYVNTIPSVGPHTCKKLAERGYVEMLWNETGRPSDERVALTRNGVVREHLEVNIKDDEGNPKAHLNHTIEICITT